MCSVRMRVLGAFILAGVLTLAIVVVTLATGSEPVRLFDALLVLVGYLARDATTRVAKHEIRPEAAHHPS